MIFIVIPVFNRKELTKACLVSLYNQSSPNFKAIVVDDGSTDGTDEMLAQEFPEVTVLKGDGNLFWTASVNMGIKEALAQGAQYVLTLNNDVVADIHYLESMQHHLKDTSKALIGSFAINYKTKEPDYGGAIIDWRWNKTTYLLDVLPKEQHYGLHRVNHFPGRGLLIPAEVFQKIGLFDEVSFPHYYADYDFTHRADKAGFPVFCSFDAKLFTYPEESGDRQNRRKKTLKNYYNHLFGIKGGGNLVNFTKYTLRHCPPQYMPTFLTLGYVRRLGGYFLK
ncbi:glycosyltransferase family 2 protein [Pontibacter silvestris]|uniref:Glycosyltransferase family 2 protein n=1 Tax=Pontibacter silvestris TaxID=2305183 RepID=A0ABW4X4J6_9BACT|nr:glycosyltransferase family 2 protein [Pontibacter silvestris]MCC9135064.1 glycosyltransferase family 2 protein [Pontibacter silvestris]